MGARKNRRLAPCRSHFETRFSETPGRSHFETRFSETPGRQHAHDRRMHHLQTERKKTAALNGSEQLFLFAVSQAPNFQITEPQTWFKRIIR